MELVIFSSLFLNLDVAFCNEIIGYKITLVMSVKIELYKSIFVWSVHCKLREKDSEIHYAWVRNRKSE